MRNYFDVSFLKRPCFEKYIKQVSFLFTINFTALKFHDYEPKNYFTFSQNFLIRNHIMKTFMEYYTKTISLTKP